MLARAAAAVVLADWLPPRRAALLWERTKQTEPAAARFKYSNKEVSRQIAAADPASDQVTSDKHLGTEVTRGKQIM